MKPTAPPRNKFSVFATTPCRGLSSRHAIAPLDEANSPFTRWVRHVPRHPAVAYLLVKSMRAATSLTIISAIVIAFAHQGLSQISRDGYSPRLRARPLVHYR